jgi:hypothetical protein
MLEQLNLLLVTVLLVNTVHCTLLYSPYGTLLYTIVQP